MPSVERHTFTIREAAGALLPDGYRDCDNIHLTVEDDTLVLTIEGQKLPKGGPLSREAAILCGRPDFWRWLDVDGQDKATASIYAACGVTSRALLDHDDAAGEAWKQMSAEFEFWQRGMNA